MRRVLHVLFKPWRRFRIWLIKHSGSDLAYPLIIMEEQKIGGLLYNPLGHMCPRCECERVWPGQHNLCETCYYDLDCKPWTPNRH